MSKPRDKSERPASGNYKFEIVEEGNLAVTNDKSTEIKPGGPIIAERIDLGGCQNAILLVTPGQGPAEMARSPVMTAENELAPFKVLVIEDDEDTAILMTQMLNSMGHSIVKATSVASAVEVLTRDKIDLIIKFLATEHVSSRERNDLSRHPGLFAGAINRRPTKISLPQPRRSHDYWAIRARFVAVLYSSGTCYQLS